MLVPGLVLSPCSDVRLRCRPRPCEQAAQGSGSCRGNQGRGICPGHVAMEGMCVGASFAPSAPGDLGRGWVGASWPAWLPMLCFLSAELGSRPTGRGMSG